MKKYHIALAVIILGFGIAVMAPTVFGGGSGATGGPGGPGSNCRGCNGSWARDMGFTNTYNDKDGSGNLSTGDTVRGSGGGGGGGGGGGNGEGGGNPPPQPAACVITLSAPVVASGAPSMNLSWTPRPNGKVTLSRALSGNRGTAITVPNHDNAKTFSDNISTLPKGTYTYTLSYSAQAGSVRGTSTSALEEEIVPVAIPEKPVSSFGEMLRQFAFGFTTPVYADHVSGGESGDSNSGRADGSHSGGGGFGGSAGGGSGGGGSSTGGGTSYSCTATFKVVDTLTQCNDGLDNNDTEDTLIDQSDPGCHTDGNPGNPKTYDPTDTSELNPPTDMVPFVTTVTLSKGKKPVKVTAAAQNTSAYYAQSNSLVYGWRDTSGSRAPSCGRRGKNCFTENGHKFLRLNTFTRAYNSMQTRTDDPRSFRPPVAGRYEVCAIADFNNTVYEGVAGEANNHTCRIITVDDDTTTTTSTIDGPLTITASPSVMRRGQTSTVEWDTGGREMCSIVNSTAEPVDFLDSDGEPRLSDEEETPPLNTQTTYTITCTDPGFEATETATIRLIPEFKEI